MRHKKKGRKLGRKVGNRRALLMNLASQLITHKRIKTTDSKAKELRTYIEPLITLAKKNDLHSRRMIIRKLQKKDIVKKETVLLNDYENFELIEMWDGGCDFWVDIVDEGSFTEEELEEINSLIYSWPVGKCPEDEDEDDDGYDEQKMEFNGWTESDCEYYVNTPVKLKVITEE